MHSTTDEQSCFPKSGCIRFRVPFFVSFLGKQKRKKKQQAAIICFTAICQKLSFLLLFCLDAKKKQKKSRQTRRPPAVLPCQRHGTTSLLIHSSQKQFRIVIVVEPFVQLKKLSEAFYFLCNCKIEKYHGRSRFNEILSVGILQTKYGY